LFIVNYYSNEDKVTFEGQVVNHVVYLPLRGVYQVVVIRLHNQINNLNKLRRTRRPGPEEVAGRGRAGRCCLRRRLGVDVFVETVDLDLAVLNKVEVFCREYLHVPLLLETVDLVTACRQNDAVGQVGGVLWWGLALGHDTLAVGVGDDEVGHDVRADIHLPSFGRNAVVDTWGLHAHPGFPTIWATSREEGYHGSEDYVSHRTFSFRSFVPLVDKSKQLVAQKRARHNAG